MSRQQKDSLRPLQDTERVSLVRLSRSASAPAAQVARARALLAVAEGLSDTNPRKESLIDVGFQSRMKGTSWPRMGDSLCGLV